MRTKRYILFLIGLSVILWCPAASVSASEKAGPELVEKIIDQKISFYEKRTRLSSSPYRILAEIGCDAVGKVRWLNENRSDLIKGAVNTGPGKRIRNVESRVRIYLSKQLNANREVISSRFCGEDFPEETPLLSAAGI